MTDFELRERVRSSAYYHLARLFEVPDAFLVEEGVFEALRVATDAVSPAAAAPAEALATAWVHEDQAAVRRDHVALFVGPGERLAPPYGSVYLDGQRALLGPSTQDVVRLFAQAGLQKSASLKDAADHVRVELDAMHVVIDRTLAAVAAGDWTAAERLVAVQAALLQNHLSRWVTPFAAAIRAGAATRYHRHVADLLEAFVRQEFLEDAPAMIDEFKSLRPSAAA